MTERSAGAFCCWTVSRRFEVVNITAHNRSMLLLRLALHHFTPLCLGGQAVQAPRVTKKKCEDCLTTSTCAPVDGSIFAQACLSFRTLARIAAAVEWLVTVCGGEDQLGGWSCLVRGMHHFLEERLQSVEDERLLVSCCS